MPDYLKCRVAVFQDGTCLRGYVMNEKTAIVFEIYRYAVCFVTLCSFSLLSYAVIGGYLADPGNIKALAGAAVGVIISLVLYVVHWRLKNPALTS